MDDTSKLRASVSAFAKSLDVPPFVHKLNELLDQQAYEQAAIEEKLAMQKIADMWVIVQKVATEDSTRRAPWTSDSCECPFCDGLSDFFSLDVKHEPDCIVTKARKMAAEAKGGA